MAGRLDLVGQRFGRLVVLERDQSKPAGAKNPVFWVCRCDCGSVTSVRAMSLRRGTTRSCGCFFREVSSAVHRKHGQTADKRTPEYIAWVNMLGRCYNPNDHAYTDYGARGITVCDAWRTSFARFLADMGKRPSAEHSLGRRDNNAGYSAQNCRWETRPQQGSNKRNNVLLTFNGKTQSLYAWSRELGIGHKTIRYRLERGWPVEKALTAPVRPYPGPRSAPGDRRV